MRRERWDTGPHRLWKKERSRQPTTIPRATAVSLPLSQSLFALVSLSLFFLIFGFKIKPKASIVILILINRPSSKQKRQSFMEMIKSAKGSSHDDDFEEDEDFVLKKESSTTTHNIGNLLCYIVTLLQLFIFKYLCLLYIST